MHSMEPNHSMDECNEVRERSDAMARLAQDQQVTKSASPAVRFPERAAQGDPQVSSTLSSRRANPGVDDHLAGFRTVQETRSSVVDRVVPLGPSTVV